MYKIILLFNAGIVWSLVILQGIVQMNQVRNLIAFYVERKTMIHSNVQRNYVSSVIRLDIKLINVLKKI